MRTKNAVKRLFNYLYMNRILFLINRNVCNFLGEANGAQYMGKLLGKLSELHHGVSGEVYAVDSRTLFIKDFTYDGQGPGK